MEPITLTKIKPNISFSIYKIQDECSFHVCSSTCGVEKGAFKMLKRKLFPKKYCEKQFRLNEIFTSVPLYRIKQRLFSLGLIPGARGVMIGNSPLNDPMIIDVDGRLISVRRVEAELILVNTGTLS